MLQLTESHLTKILGLKLGPAIKLRISIRDLIQRSLSASTASTSRSLLAALRDDRVIEELPGTIQLAAALDRMLHDDAGLMTRGLAVEGALMHAPRELVQALGQVTPLTGTQTSVTHWQPIGPQAPAHADALVVAVDTPPKKTTAQRIEDDLAALKAKLAKETSS